MYKLTRVRALDNPDDPVVTLDDLVGSKDLVRMYQFNYMHDIDWVMSHTQANPESHFVYGYYGQDVYAPMIAQLKKKWNVTGHGKVLPGPYSTHHTKMMILFYKDGTCNVVVHTANLIEFDWANMTQGVWQSGRLARGNAGAFQTFRSDLVRYIKAYGMQPLEALASELQGYDFERITDKFIASVPGNYMSAQWALKRMEKELPSTNKVVIQCSSVASLPKDYLDVFRTRMHTKELAIVYPTVEQIANSLNGYGSGASIHLKRQKPAQKEQYDRLKPLFHSWRSLKAGRQMAAPHIKTYVGLVDSKVQWFLLTSANLSKQAWGVVNKKRKTEWIQSWEAGVLRVFKERQAPAYYRDKGEYCLPYDLELTKYSGEDVAWSADEVYKSPDIYGRQWPF